MTGVVLVRANRSWATGVGWAERVRCGGRGSKGVSKGQVKNTARG